jgi:hypothetical protein
MVIFDGKFEWDGKKRSEKFPISWWPGSYQIKIIDLKDRAPGAVLMRPYLCILSDTGEGFSIKNTFERFALSVCDKFGLEVEKVLWVEENAINENMGAAMVKAVMKIGGKYIYETTWRPIRPNEMNLVESCLTEH